MKSLPPNFGGLARVLELNFGVFRHVAGDDEDHHWILAFGLGTGI